MKKLTLLFSLFSLTLYAQQIKTSNDPAFTPASQRMKGLEQHRALEERSMLSGVKFRNVGPSVMSGRVVDIEVNPKDATHFFVAYATGGLWETRNNGTTFEPLFDNEWVFGIGDVAIDWNRDVIYVGTGENNSSRSSYAGIGLFRSTDHGKSWQHLGLEETHHIGRVILHPADPKTIWVASIGHLFTPNKDRGIYKSTDGGKTWKQTLFINENTGVIDLLVNAKDPNELYAASWHRERRAWNFVESGSGSGIYKSNDGGTTWKLLTTPESGFPTGDGVGRIGIAQCKNKPEVLYAILDNQFPRKTEKKESDPTILTKDQLKKMTKEDFLALDDKKIKSFLRSNGFPKKITVEIVREKISAGSIKPAALAEYLEDANALLFDTPVTGAEFYRSNDGGKSWKKTHENYIDDLVYTYGYYFGQVTVDENNPDKIWAAAFVVIKSEDGGKTFQSINGDNVHVDHHALYVDPNKAGHLINGNDGGVNISYDNGKSWIKCNNPAVGQFYTVNVDMATPYNIYGGLQDNGVWHGPSTHIENTLWHMEGNYPWKTIMGGDGMQVMIDPRDNNTVYTGYQFGHYFRINKTTGESFYMTPKHELGERPLRWNWQTPIWLSEHSADVIYMGANKVFRSLKQGEEFKAISGDLTKGGKQGDVAFGTTTTIHESPIKFGVIYAGTDDGLVWVTRDAGTSWINITGNLPADYIVRRVQASRFVEGRVYVCLNGHTRDDFSSYLFTSEDFGKTWTRIGLDLPMEPINVVREDVQNPNLIFIGTDHGVYASLNRGKQFHPMRNGVPNVPVHDLVIHPRDHDLVIGTHGRSVYVASVRELQDMNDSIVNRPAHLFPMQTVYFDRQWGSAYSYWDKPVEPSVLVPVWINSATNKTVQLMVKDKGGRTLYSGEYSVAQGMNYLNYGLHSTPEEAQQKSQHKGANGKWYLGEGEYELIIVAGKSELKEKLSVELPQ